MSFTYRWERAKITAGVTIFRIPTENRFSTGWDVLLVKRGQEPAKGKWNLPGGHMEMNETLIQCAMREVFEETNLDLLHFEVSTTLQFDAIYDKVCRFHGDPWEDRVVHIQYWIGIPEPVTDKIDFKAGDDASDLVWFSIREILGKEGVTSGMDLAFDHKKIIQSCVTKAEKFLSKKRIEHDGEILWNRSLG